MKFNARCIKETGGDFFVSEDGENGRWRRANAPETIRHCQKISRALFFLVDDSGLSDWSLGLLKESRDGRGRKKGATSPLLVWMMHLHRAREAA